MDKSEKVICLGGLFLRGCRFEWCQSWASSSWSSQSEYITNWLNYNQKQSLNASCSKSHLVRIMSWQEHPVWSAWFVAHWVLTLLIKLVWLNSGTLIACQAERQMVQNRNHTVPVLPYTYVRKSFRLRSAQSHCNNSLKCHSTSCSAKWKSFKLKCYSRNETTARVTTL